MFFYFSCLVNFMFDNSLSNTSNLTWEHGICAFISFKNSLGTICTPFIESVKTPKFKEMHVALRRKCRRSSRDSCLAVSLLSWELRYIHFLTIAGCISPPCDPVALCFLWSKWGKLPKFNSEQQGSFCLVFSLLQCQA